MKSPKCLSNTVSNQTISNFTLNSIHWIFKNHFILLHINMLLNHVRLILGSLLSWLISVIFFNFYRPLRISSRPFGCTFSQSSPAKVIMFLISFNTLDTYVLIKQFRLAKTTFFFSQFFWLKIDCHKLELTNMQATISNLMNFLNRMKKAMAEGYMSQDSRKLKNCENNNKVNVATFHNSNH